MESRRTGYRSRPRWGRWGSGVKMARPGGLRDTRAHGSDREAPSPMNHKSLVLAVFAAAMASACTSAGHGAAVSRSTSAAPAERLNQSHPCAGIAGFVCSTLTVPLDHSGHTPGTVDLQVAAADNVNAPRGVLLFLTGGPGQPGVPFVPRIANRVGPVLKDYRLVMFDQRGTGQFGAINCPALQAAVGSSDITVPPP